MDRSDLLTSFCLFCIELVPKFTSEKSWVCALYAPVLYDR